MSGVGHYRFEDAHVGATFSIRRQLGVDDVDSFATISGDVSPLHMSAEFAKRHGHPDRVVHGVLLGSLLSQLVGVHFPGRLCLLQRMHLDFVAPAYVGDVVDARIEVRFVSEATRTLELRGTILDLNGKKLVRAMVQVGFLPEAAGEP